MSDLTREEYLKHAWDWTHEYGGIILKQLRRVGASCDWDRTAFTMDEKRSESVIKVFVDLYRKGLIYRGVRMVNWDPKAKTALSDEEDAKDVFGIEAEATDIYGGKLNAEGYKSVAKQLADKFHFEKVAITLRESHNASRRIEGRSHPRLCTKPP